MPVIRFRGLTAPETLVFPYINLEVLAHRRLAGLGAVAMILAGMLGSIPFIGRISTARIDFTGCQIRCLGRGGWYFIAFINEEKICAAN